MRGRFGINEHIEFYSPEALHEILRANVKLLKLVAARSSCTVSIQQVSQVAAQKSPLRVEPLAQRPKHSELRIERA